MTATILNLVGPDALVVIALIGILIFGPKKLPELAKGIRSAFQEFKKGKDE